jgi:hypothetical protein
MDHGEIGWEVINWIHLAQDMAVMNTAMNFGFHSRKDIS